MFLIKCLELLPGHSHVYQEVFGWKEMHSFFSPNLSATCTLQWQNEDLSVLKNQVKYLIQTSFFQDGKGHNCDVNGPLFCRRWNLKMKKTDPPMWIKPEEDLLC